VEGLDAMVIGKGVGKKEKKRKKKKKCKNSE
jgi:hypothetical protein